MILIENAIDKLINNKSLNSIKKEKDSIKSYIKNSYLKELEFFLYLPEEFYEENHPFVKYFCGDISIDPSLFKLLRYEFEYSGRKVLTTEEELVNGKWFCFAKLNDEICRASYVMDKRSLS